MARSKPKRLDALAENCDDLQRCKEILETLYYTCGMIEIAIEHLITPYNPMGLDFMSVVEQVKVLKEILDGQLKLVRYLHCNIQSASDTLQELKDVDVPELVNNINHKAVTLLRHCGNARKVLQQAAIACKGFHLACQMVLDFLAEYQSTELE